MLVHHADMQCGGVVGVIDFDGFSILADLALLRLIQAKQHAHQRGLARAVFSQQRVDFAPPQLQRDVVVGLDAGEFLGDMKHLDHIIVFVIQDRSSPFFCLDSVLYKKSRKGEKPSLHISGEITGCNPQSRWSRGPSRWDRLPRLRCRSPERRTRCLPA